MSVKTDDPPEKKRERGRPGYACRIQAVLKLLADDDNYPLRGKNGVRTREDQCRVVKERLHEQRPNEFPGGNGIKDGVIKRELRIFEIRENLA